MKARERLQRRVNKEEPAKLNLRYPELRGLRSSGSGAEVGIRKETPKWLVNGLTMREMRNIAFETLLGLCGKDWRVEVRDGADELVMKSYGKGKDNLK